MPGKEQQEVGQFGVGQRVPFGQQDALECAASGQQMPQAANALLLVGEGPARRAVRRGRPVQHEAMTVLAEVLQDVQEQRFRPQQGPPDPA